MHADTSELRQDPVSGKWVVIAGGRAKRPHDYAKLQPRAPALPPYEARCVFCNIERSGQLRPTLVRPRGKDWKVCVFPNKFPAFHPEDDVRVRAQGPYTVMDGVGFHEVIVVRPHNGFFADLSREDARLYLWAWRERYRVLMEKRSVAYIQIIENHGRESGGTVLHPHVQVFAIPVLPSDEVLDLVQGAEKYFLAHGRCAYCDILDFERREGTRVVWENDAFTVLCPFTSRVPVEQWVLPRTHRPGFEALRDDDLPKLTDALQAALRRLNAGYRSPAYNLYVYSAPCDTAGYVCPVDEFQHFHWHIQILPRLNIWGGFELATGLEIHSAVPEEAAAHLRQQEI